MEYLHKNREQFKEAAARTAENTGFVAEAVEKEEFFPILLTHLFKSGQSC